MHTISAEVELLKFREQPKSKEGSAIEQRRDGSSTVVVNSIQPSKYLEVERTLQLEIGAVIDT